MKRLSLALMTVLLSACNNITTPAIPLPSATVPLKASSVLAVGKVVYLDKDLLGGHGLPSIFREVSISGNALYNATLGTMSGLKVYMRSSLSNLPATCLSIPATASTPGVAMCDPAGESAQQISTVSVTSATKVPFTMSGPALDAAAKAGHGFIGVEITNGLPVEGETLSLLDLAARAKI